jgi:hypothetical protein
MSRAVNQEVRVDRRVVMIVEELPSVEEAQVGALITALHHTAQRRCKAGSKGALTTLKISFLLVRFDRLTPTERSYLKAMAKLGSGPHRSGDNAFKLKPAVTSLGPTRNALLAKEMIWSPAHWDAAFSVPLLDEFMRRIMPGEGWRGRAGVGQ